MDYRPRRNLRLLPLAGVGLATGLLAAALVAAPRVAAVTPAPAGSGISTRTSIRILFNQPMDKASVEAHLRVDPPAGRVTWQGNAIVLDPAPAWPSGATVEVRLEAGARSTRWLPMLRGAGWSFRVGSPRILYLWPATGPADVYVRAIDGSDPVRVTHSAYGVLAYDLSGDGSTLVISVLRPDGGSDLHSVALSGEEDRLIYACPATERCQAPAVSPAGDYVAFEMLAVQGGGATAPVLGPSQVWAIGTASGSKAFPVGAPGHVTQLPTWSPGGLLAFDDATAGAILVVDPGREAAAAPLTQFASSLGEVGSWSPDGMSLVFPEVVFPETTPQPTPGSVDERAPVFFSHLNRAEVVRGTIIDLTGAAGLVEDASPAFSPDGAWIAFARKYLDPARWSLGRQLWLMQADGSGARALTREPSFNHSAIAWSADSAMLAYMRFNMADPGRPGEIWWMSLDGEEGHLLIRGGYQPRWVP